MTSRQTLMLTSKNKTKQNKPVCQSGGIRSCCGTSDEPYCLFVSWFPPFGTGELHVYFIFFSQLLREVVEHGYESNHFINEDMEVQGHAAQGWHCSALAWSNNLAGKGLIGRRGKGRDPPLLWRRWLAGHHKTMSPSRNYLGPYI